MEPFPDHPDPRAVHEYREVVLAGYKGDEDAVRRACASEFALARQAALGAAVRVGLRDCESLVRSGFEDPDPSVRRRAAELCVGLSEVQPSDLLSDADSTVVEVACFACGEIGQADPERFQAGPPITTLGDLALQPSDALVREAAVAALGAIGNPDSLPVVIEACADRVTVRRRAVLALAAFEDPSADETLRAALDDKDWQVRQAAEDLLQVGRRLEGEPDPDAYADI